MKSSLAILAYLSAFVIGCSTSEYQTVCAGDELGGAWTEPSLPKKCEGNCACKLGETMDDYSCSCVGENEYPSACQFVDKSEQYVIGWCSAPNILEFWNCGADVDMLISAMHRWPAKSGSYDCATEGKGCHCLRTDFCGCFTDKELRDKLSGE